MPHVYALLVYLQRRMRILVYKIQKKQQQQQSTLYVYSILTTLRYTSSSILPHSFLCSLTLTPHSVSLILASTFTQFCVFVCVSHSETSRSMVSHCFGCLEMLDFNSTAIKFHTHIQCVYIVVCGWVFRLIFRRLFRSLLRACVHACMRTVLYVCMSACIRLYLGFIFEAFLLKFGKVRIKRLQ